MELTYMMKTKMEILKALCIIDENIINQPLIIYHASFCVENRSPVQIFTAGIFI